MRNRLRFKNSAISANTELDLAILHTKRVPLESFGVLISALIEDLSIGRAQIVVEQIRRIAESGQHERLVILTTSDSGPDSCPLAAVVAVFQAGIEGKSISDVATIVHAGALRQMDAVSQQSAIAMLSTELEREFRRNGIDFAQWATDPISPNGASDRCWCTEFGFQRIGTLDYLCGPVPNDPRQPFGSSSPPEHETKSLRFLQFPWTKGSAFSELVDLVERTFAETLDCPGLSAFRTTEQVLNGYRTADAFAPNLWFTVNDHNGQQVGCAILATHPSHRSAENADDSNHVGSVEIVYMGLIPAARGSGFGKQLVQQAFDVAREVGADQVLLAVDQINHPAKAIYQLAGLKPIVHETVWVKSVAREADQSNALS